MSGPSALATLIDHLEAERATLAEDLALVDERLRLARELADTWEGSLPEPQPAPKPSPKPAAKSKSKPKSSAKKHRQIPCPDCGLLCNGGTGLSAHRRSKHPGSAAKPVRLRPVPADEPTPPEFGDGPTEPITRTRFDEQAARERAGAAL